jgi:hypothetical protein
VIKVSPKGLPKYHQKMLEDAARKSNANGGETIFLEAGTFLLTKPLLDMSGADMKLFGVSIITRSLDPRD